MENDSDIRRLPLFKTLASKLEDLRHRQKADDSPSYDPDDEDSEEPVENDEDEEEPVQDVEDVKEPGDGEDGLSPDKKESADKEADKSKPIGEKYIVTKFRSAGLTPVSPHDIDEAAREVLRDCFGDADDMSFLIPCGNNEEGYEQSLAKYRGGRVFRENMRYWLMRHCMLDADQTARFLGNTGVTTLGRHYIDSNNLANQYVVASKLWRLDALLSGYGKLYAGREEIDLKPSSMNKISSDAKYPLEVDLTIEAEEDGGEFTMIVTSKHGLATIASSTEGRNE